MSKVESIFKPKNVELPIKVSKAYLQTGITVEGHCSAESNMQKIDGLKMTLTSQGLLLEFRERKDAKACYAIVPETNVKVMVFETL